MASARVKRCESEKSTECRSVVSRTWALEPGFVGLGIRDLLGDIFIIYIYL